MNRWIDRAFVALSFAFVVVYRYGYVRGQESAVDALDKQYRTARARDRERPSRDTGMAQAGGGGSGRPEY